MSILIKGMEMPTSCFDCPFMYGRKYCSVNTRIEFNDPEYSELRRRYDGCPLAPVPPHGDLVERDALLYELPAPVEDEYKIARRIVSAAPTVIPAEEGET